MEPHKTIGTSKYNITLNDPYLEYFRKAKDFTMDNYSDDFNRIANTKFNEVSPQFFLTELVWCICVSGFNSKIVSNFFPKMISILNPMFDEVSNGWFRHFDDYEKPLLKIFNNKRKIDAIIYNSNELVAKNINKIGWEQYRDNELNEPEKLEKFAMVGPAISKHLARNIGLLNFVKPDIHLKRLAVNWGFNDPDELCLAIQKEFNMPLGLIDLSLFYCAATFGSK